VTVSQQHITEHALHLFLRHGFKSVTVDDIARESGISKKTLYEQFPDKDAIIKVCIHCHEQKLDKLHEHFCGVSENAVHEIILVMKTMQEMLSAMNANCVSDLQRYYPEAFLEFRKHMNGQKNLILANLKRGVKEGLYRKDIDIEFTAWLRMEQIVFLIQHPTVTKQFDFVKAQLESIKLFLYSISTIEGHQLIEKYINQIKRKKQVNTIYE
jgi:AcrR family transcriptional regulator